MKRLLDVEEILTVMQGLANASTGAVTVAILACMDVVELHGRIADELELRERLQVEPVPSILVQHPAARQYRVGLSGLDPVEVTIDEVEP